MSCYSVMNRTYYQGILLALAILSCSEPLDVETATTEPSRLYVEGYVTTAPGPHYFTLSRTALYQPVRFAQVQPELRATVAIRDSQGDYVPLVELGGGAYQTPPEFCAEVGTAYSMLISTQDGGEYQSFPQLVTPVPPIDEVFLRFDFQPTLDEDEFESGMEVFSSFQDNPETQDYYMWVTSDGVYPWTARPELWEQFASEAFPPPCPPEIFSQTCWRYERSYNEPGPSNPDGCLLTETFNRNFYLGNDFNLAESSSTQLSAYISDDGLRFQIKYRFILNQLSISPEAYNFYQRLSRQLEISGSIFDAPPAEIRGNFFSTIDTDEVIIGFFGAYDVSKYEVFIPAELLEMKQVDVLYINDCVTLDSSTTAIPEWWPQ